MPVLESKIDTSSKSYLANRAAMLSLIAEVRDIEARIRAHGERQAQRFAEQGKLLPRTRIERLLDPGTTFLEFSSLAGYGMHDDDGETNVMGGGHIAGIGFVAGVRCLISVTDSAIKGGIITPMGLKKNLRSQEIARRNRLPVISLVESGGANLLYQSEIFVDGGKVFANMARLSAAGIPQITVVHGNSTAGGAYLPGLSDYVIMVRNQAKVFLAGPPLVKAAIGEDADEEELGGAVMHATISGTAEYLADDDAHALKIARELMGKLSWRDANNEREPVEVVPPLFDIDELCGIVPTDTRYPYDVGAVIARLVDGSEFLAFKAGWGADTLCGHASIYGQACGIVANQRPIQPEGSSKAAQFIQLCCQMNMPIVYLMNTTGYMVGKRAEQRGAIKHGAKMIQAVANATVPQLTVVTGGGFGAGNYGMCGRSFDPRFIFAWPNSKVAVMGGAQAGTVMEIITRAKLKRRGKPVDDDALKAMSKAVQSKLDQESSALFASARIWDDGLIDPRDTRTILGFALATCQEATERSLYPNTFGVARL